MKIKTKTIVIIAMSILINIFGRKIAQELDGPIWFDMTGTILATYYTGIWGGIIAAILNNVIIGFGNYSAIIYCLPGVVATFLIWYFVKKGYLNNALNAVIASFWLGVVCTIVSTPINCIFYDGYSGNAWGDILVDMLKWYNVNEGIASMAGEFIIEIVDKQLCMLVACVIIFIVKNIDKKAVATSLLVIMGINVLMPLSALTCVNANTDKYMTNIYNNTSGMMSSEANVICGTDDGYIWIGSYAGLTRYDGNTFEFVSESGLVNVVSMMTDSKGRLWIGTNDAGIARYEDGKYTYFTTQNGLPTDSIRSFAEDANGNVYVGTSDKMCKFNANDEIEILNNGITFAKSMIMYNDTLMILDNAGNVYGLLDGKKLTIVSDEIKDKFYYCICLTSRGLLLGSETGELYIIEITSDGIELKEQIDTAADAITALYEDSNKNIWMATKAGFGYLDFNNQYHPVKVKDFDSSIDCFFEDYQGNMWLASSRYGVMKLSASLFVNLFEKAGVEGDIVNAIEYYQNNIFCGTEKGLVVLNDNYNVVAHPLIEATKGYRIRAIYADADENLWICSYNGLICYDKNANIKTYTVADGTTSDRFRCITSLADGTVVAATADGINFIKGGIVTETITKEDGLENTQILSMAVDQEGNVLAGSDGSGIYVISNGKLSKKYTVNDGLSSNVILRIVPYENGYFIVTSNALCYMNVDGNINKIKNFPYFNNYDIIIKDEKAYITCSAGLYIVETKQLLEDDFEQYTFYGANEGLVVGLTANSWNYVTNEGDLLFCTNEGAIIFDNHIEQTKINIKFGLSAIECDGKLIDLSESNNYILPATTKNITLHASVRNYACENLKVHFYVKEFGVPQKMYEWNAIDTINISDVEENKYTVCMRVYDSSGEVLFGESIYTINIELHPWQTKEYKTYLILVGLEIIIFTIISIASMIMFVTRKNELEKVRVKLAKTVEEQTSELKYQQNKTKQLLVQTITALSEAVDAKDRYTSGHSKRVAQYAKMIAARMGKSKAEQEEIYRAGLLHDVGKIRIPAEIINKPGKLTDEEYNVIKIHPITGYHILKDISDNGLIALGTKYHHERYDGKGYPNGLVGDKIPEVARILGVADAYDAMASNRSYRDALPQSVVRSEIEKGRGTQFDPQIADIMLQMMAEDTDYTMKQPDAIVRKILVVDDEPMNVKIISHIMKDDKNYEIIPASSGREALAILEKQSVDLVLLDVMMPEMDGLEISRIIKEKYDIPIVLMTADRTLETSSEFSSLGCDDYITKPFLPLLIKEVIHNMTERINLEE